MTVAHSQQSASVTRSLSPHAIVTTTALVTAGATGNSFRCHHVACGRVDMAFNRTPSWLTLAATIFVAAHASALETLPGEPPVEDRQQAIQERVAPSDERLASGRGVATGRG